MANQPQNPQHQQNQPRNAPPKQGPGKGQAGKSGADSDRPGTQPQNPADLGHDPKPDDIQAGRLGQSGEKSQH